jgi:galacturan 1,4-alpha-galacturonidase
MHIPFSTILLLLPTLTLSTPHSPLIPISPLESRSVPRNRTCTVTALGNNKDDSAALLSAIASCNNGGIVALHSPLYTIATPLNLTYLSSIDFSIHGTIAFSPNVSYWSTASFKYPFQDSAAFIQFGGTDVNFYGDGLGVIDGKGQVWYDAFAKNSDVVRPILWVLNGLKGGSMTGLTMRNSPMWFNFFVGVQDFVVSGMTLEASSTSGSAVKNTGRSLLFSGSRKKKGVVQRRNANKPFPTDGWDTYQSSHLTIQNSTIHNQDDCVSFKPNSTDILVQNLYCNGSHGISVGSLGQYPGVTDIVQNIVVRNTTLGYASDAARIKVWAGEVPGSDYGTGGGNGVVKNITYDGMTVVKDDCKIMLL